MDKTSEIYGRYHRGDICHSRHKYHVCVTNTIINIINNIITQNTVGVTAREATAKPPWRAIMTSKAVSRNLMKIILMSMIVTLKYE